MRVCNGTAAHPCYPFHWHLLTIIGGYIHNNSACLHNNVLSCFMSNLFYHQNNNSGKRCNVRDGNVGDWFDDISNCSHI